MCDWVLINHGMYTSTVDDHQKAVTGLQMLSKAMGHHSKGENPGNKTHIDHILEKHWKELHLPEISAADLITMLSNSQTEALPKFKMFNTH